MEREWRAGGVASALDRASLLEGVFESCEMWTMRITWMNAVLDRLQKEQWGAKLDGLDSCRPQHLAAQR
eukprot:2786824-Pleurochrysis_carterae.AAC.1